MCNIYAPGSHDWFVPNTLLHLNTNQVKIYPNPAISEVKIEWMGEVNSIELTDARGRLICTYNVSQVSTITIGIDHVDSGVYFIHVFAPV